MELLLVAIVLFLAIFAIKISSKSGVPALLLFIVLGMAFSAAGFEFEDYQFADNFATIALMVILFQGGFSTNWSMAKPVAKEAIVLSFLGVVTTALLTGVFCRYFLGFGWIEGMLIGSIVGSTDYASVSNILRSRNLNLRYNTAPLLELESGSNDPSAYTMTMVFLSILLGDNISIPLMIVKQLVFGIGLGFFMSHIMMKLIRKMSFDSDGLFIIFMVAASLLTFSATAAIGGNGYLAVYIFGIVIGNKQFKGKRDSVFFFDGFSNLMQIGLFFILGLLSQPSRFIATLPMAAAIMIFMTIIARPLSVFGLMLPFKLKTNQLLVISMAGLRGAAAIAFAIMAVNAGAGRVTDIYHVVFGICVLSSLVQGSLMAPFSTKTDMLDPNDTVLKTFNDYQDKSELGFIQTPISSHSRWVGKQVKELNLAFNVIVAKIDRDGKTIVPRGDTVIEEGDIIVLGGETHFDASGHDLVEFTISEGHEWANRLVKDLDLQTDELIIMLQRTDQGVIVPIGNTEVLPGDKLVTIKGS